MHDQASYLLRFFSRTQELPIGGHCCHAAAHLIYELGLLPPGEDIIFLTQEGEIPVRRVLPDLTSVRFTAQNLNKMDQTNINLYADILGINSKAVSWAGITLNRFALLAADNTVQLRRVDPDRIKLQNTGASVLAITALDHSGSDYCLRCFTPSLLFPEHLVSGSIHRYLGPKWGKILQKTELQAKQLSSRGGTVQIDLTDPKYVVMTARSRTILRSDVVLDLLDNFSDMPP
jgi:predicted PhzF superfamily epimerase YddE/YHI9